jgi:hypothetical protein
MTTPTTGAQLFSLLPALYRIADADNDGVLGELIDALADQIAVLSADLDQFYDDQFIETCADWIAPYIGDLIGYRPMYGSIPSVALPRADVANTIRNRRRKGTALMLEQLARDVTGWPAKEVEYFQLLVCAQYMKHIRPNAAATPDLRDHEALGFIGSPFDPTSRTVDVRRITTAAGYHPTPNPVGGPGAARYNIKNVGVHVWRIGAVKLVDVPCVPAVAGDRLRFRIDSLNRDMPIYASARPVPEGTPIQADQAPVPLGRRMLADHIGDYYGPGKAVQLAIFDGTTATPIDNGDIVPSDLSDTPGGGWAHQPATTDHYAIDPVLGRIYLNTELPATTTLLVTYHYGQAVPCGAGGRDRHADPPAVATATEGTGLQNAVVAVAHGGAALINDSWTYPGNLTVTAPPPAAGTEAAPLTIRASNLARPVLGLTDPMHLQIGAGREIVLDGLLIAGASVVLDADDTVAPRTLILTDCTLVPGLRRNPDNTPASMGTAALIVLDPYASVTLSRCTVGPIIAVEGAKITLRDCIIDSGAPGAVAYAGRPVPAGQTPTVTGAADQQVGDGMTAGGPLTICSSTVIGAVHTTVLAEVSDSIMLAGRPAGWPAPVWSTRRQDDCIRFSWLPAESLVGRRFHCQPDSVPPASPVLTSTRFDDAGYCQLDPVTAPEILRGADDQSEMGVTRTLYVAQRGANLVIRLTEYLRFGLEAGYIDAS